MNQMLPSGPTVIAAGSCVPPRIRQTYLADHGMGRRLKIPIPPGSVNHRLPSGPAVICDSKPGKSMFAGASEKRLKAGGDAVEFNTSTPLTSGTVIQILFPIEVMPAAG